MNWKKKLLLFMLLPLAMGGFVAYRGVIYWWNRGRSEGTQTGYLRKISITGSPICKHVSGELVREGSGAKAEIWEFSTDSKDPKSELYRQLEAAAQKGGLVTLEYREDLEPFLYRCAPTNFYVTGIRSNQEPGAPKPNGLSPRVAPSAPAPSAPAPSAPAASAPVPSAASVEAASPIPAAPPPGSPPASAEPAAPDAIPSADKTRTQDPSAPGK